MGADEIEDDAELRDFLIFALKGDLGVFLIWCCLYLKVMVKLNKSLSRLVKKLGKINER